MTALCGALAGVLERPGISLADACVAVTETMREQSEDDITLVLARIRQ